MGNEKKRIINTMNPVPVYPTKRDIPLNLPGIPQSDISKLLHNYPGLNSHLVGLRIELQTTGEKCSGYTIVDVLFRVCSYQEFLELAVQFQSRVWPQGLFQQVFLSKPYQIEIVPDIETFQESLLMPNSNIEGRVHQGLVSGSGKNVHGSQGILSEASVQEAET